MLYGGKGSKIISGTLWIAFFVVGVCISPYCSLLYATSVACIFVGAGFLLKHYLFPKYQQNGKTNLQKWILPVSFLIYASCFVLNIFVFENSLEFSAGSFGILPLYVLGALAAAVFLMRTAYQVKECKGLQHIGRNSLVYYALHYEVLAVGSFIVEKLIPATFWVSSISFIFTVVATTAVVWLYNKAKIGKLFQ